MLIYVAYYCTMTDIFKILHCKQNSHEQGSAVSSRREHTLTNLLWDIPHQLLVRTPWMLHITHQKEKCPWCKAIYLYIEIHRLCLLCTVTCFAKSVSHKPKGKKREKFYGEIKIQYLTIHPNVVTKKVTTKALESRGGFHFVKSNTIFHFF